MFVSENRRVVVFDAMGVLYSAGDDEAEWLIRYLRVRFGLEKWISTWVISGDIGVRKPDPASFRTLAQDAGVPLDDMVFFDDAQRNIDAATFLGMDAVRFTSVDSCRMDLMKRGFGI